MSQGDAVHTTVSVPGILYILVQATLATGPGDPLICFHTLPTSTDMVPVKCVRCNLMCNVYCVMLNEDIIAFWCITAVLSDTIS